jgi:porphobilinogen synthase
MCHGIVTQESHMRPELKGNLARPRRNRRSPALRDLMAETSLGAQHLVLPLFIREGSRRRQAIASMPGVERLSLDLGLKQVEQARTLGIRAVALFPYIEPGLRSETADEALNPDGLTPRVIAAVKRRFPDVALFSDIALDPFSALGHDGLVRKGEILNDETVAVLAAMAVIHAEAGADVVSPSDMMDGRVLAIRQALDAKGLSSTGILSYAAKYASSFYGPFRDALDSAPKFGDKKTYQMDLRNAREAVREVQLDVAEGADMVMVKPALAYLDIIRLVRETVHIPVAAYNVSGEYSMIKAAAARGWLDHDKAMAESLYAMRRAGADFIFTYFALEMARWLKRQR